VAEYHERNQTRCTAHLRKAASGAADTPPKWAVVASDFTAAAILLPGAVMNLVFAFG